MSVWCGEVFNNYNFIGDVESMFCQLDDGLRLNVEVYVIFIGNDDDNYNTVSLLVAFNTYDFLASFSLLHYNILTNSTNADNRKYRRNIVDMCCC